MAAHVFSNTRTIAHELWPVCEFWDQGLPGRRVKAVLPGSFHRDLWPPPPTPAAWCLVRASDREEVTPLAMRRRVAWAPGSRSAEPWWVRQQTLGSTRSWNKSRASVTTYSDPVTTTSSGWGSEAIRLGTPSRTLPAASMTVDGSTVQAFSTLSHAAMERRRSEEQHRTGPADGPGVR